MSADLPPLDVHISGQQLLDNPLLNKGSAFTEAERLEFDLLGLLPPHVATLDEQLVRTYESYRQKPSDLEKYIYLAALHDRNETLFYALVQAHVSEMLPIIYTPTVGLACQQYSHIYRRPRGIYLAYPYRQHLAAMLGHAPIKDVRVIVVTDGERILGLGDLGVGGMGIPVGKLSLYTLCAGIHPATTLPVVLDTGTNNQELLEDPLYLGWRHQRVRGAEYDDFVESFVQAVRNLFPNAILQWEDFAKQNAARLLERYRDQLCTFNDDIQGTGAVTLAGLITAADITGIPLGEQRVVILGAGSAAIGIADQIVAAMVHAGRSLAEARAAIWLVDSRGLVHSGRADLEPAKQVYAHPVEQVAAWGYADLARIPLLEVVQQVRPTALLGTAAQPGAFNEAIVRAMAAHAPRPVIFPLSNPTSKSEARPADLLAWTDGRALVATGSPFAPVNVNGQSVPIGQCNNAFIFPGVGLGVLVSGARRVTDGMFIAAARALSARAPMRRDPRLALYPALEDVRQVSRDVAHAVARAAMAEGVAPPMADDELARGIEAAMWQPVYRPYRRVAAPPRG
ncbi:MAG: NAD-dependent malic enzyme [Chloroflexaceae bacterium]|nr:NAD-dependent malic enzyme [Chloroflexaceae bacterium]